MAARQPRQHSNQPNKQQTKPNDQTSPKTSPVNPPAQAINKDELIAEIIAKLTPVIEVQVAAIHNSYQAETQAFMQHCMSEMTSHFKSLVDTNMSKQEPKPDQKPTTAAKTIPNPISSTSQHANQAKQLTTAASKKLTNSSFSNKQNSSHA